MLIVKYSTCRQYTLHKSFCKAKIDTENLDLWEESIDGSGMYQLIFTYLHIYLEKMLFTLS